MSKATWQDTTSSRGNKDDKWTTKIFGVDITIHHYLGCGNTWFVSCHQVHLEKHQLKAGTSDEAKVEALTVLVDWINKRIEGFQKLSKAVAKMM